MSRAEDCLDAAHLHVKVCQRAGYANGRADVIEELEARNCRTCRFWQPPSERVDLGGNCVTYADDRYDETANDDWGGYKHGDAADRLFGECHAITLGQDLPPGPPPLAVTQDASNYVATLYTQAEFGCAMHQPTGETA